MPPKNLHCKVDPVVVVDRKNTWRQGVIKELENMNMHGTGHKEKQLTGKSRSLMDLLCYPWDVEE